MSSEWSDFLSRDELLGGLPARRASTLLFAIEGRTAHLMVQSRHAMTHVLAEKSAEARERAFLDALAHGRDLPLYPRILDIERYAPDWAALVPDDPGVRAALARMLGEKYRFPARETPHLRRALGLDTPAVQAAFERLHGRPLASIFAERLSWRERVQWKRAAAAEWLETLPPFWTAFALTLTETVGAGILALPIALAEVGPLAGVVILIVFGLVNILTIAAIAEAVARSGNVRYGQAYYGRLVSDYLGRVGALLLTPALITITTIGLLVFYVGLSATLTDATSIPMGVWAALMFMISIVVLRRESLNATVASSLVIGACSIGLILLLSLMTLPHVSAANLRHSQVPFVNGEPWTPSILELIFGVVLLAYFGHTSAGNCAAVVLRREPSGRAFIWGSVAAIGCSIGLYCLWVLAVNGAVVSSEMSGEAGTALSPLADEAGNGVLIFGSIFVVLAMGMGMIHMSTGLYNQIRDWLPKPRRGVAATGFWSAPRGQMLIGFIPLAFICVAVQVLFISGRESFAGPLGFLGVIAGPIMAGMLPMLMLLAARRKGDCAVGMAWRIVGRPLVVAAVYLTFLASLFVHGTLVWQEPYQQVPAIMVGFLMIAATWVFIRRGSFDPGAAVELRLDNHHDARGVVNALVRGELADAELVLSYRDGAEIRSDANNGSWPLAGWRSANIALPARALKELKVWVHQLTPEGVSEGVDATVEVFTGQGTHTFSLDRAHGDVVLPLSGDTDAIRIRIAAD